MPITDFFPAARELSSPDIRTLSSTNDMMTWKQLVSRLRGLSFLGSGASWQSPEAERDVARRVVTFFEDRRVLYNPYRVEVPEHCVESVIEIRRFLTDELGDLYNDDGIAENLRAMRAACRQFLNTVQRSDGEVIIARHRRSTPETEKFFSALGELRATVGIHLSIIAANHHIDIHGDLEDMVPPGDEDA